MRAGFISRVPTRTFVVEANGVRRFWDVTWDAGEVEISSGKWGSSGRARNLSFASVAERDAFIATEIRKVMKKGFVEANGVAPAPDAPTPNITHRVDTWRRCFEALWVTAWLPVFGAPAPVDHGRVRGPMTLRADEGWPACPSCSRPMSALLELDCTRLPAAHLRRPTLVQLFGCEAWSSEEESSARCILKGWLARLHAPGDPRHSGPNTHGKETSIIGWTAIEELPLKPEAELLARFDEEDHEVFKALVQSAGGTLQEETGFAAYSAWANATGRIARNLHKLGGIPTFVQDCTVPFSHLLFQIEANDPFDVNFGDLGAGHLLLKASGGVSFYWAGH